MKNLKKVLAMVLAFACTFTMFASAKMYEDVQPGTEFSEAITMLSDLGIIQGKTDNKYHPEDTITRAEACALIARLMTGDPNAAGFNGAHHFKDVPAGHWASSAIGYAVVNGIAVGVDQAGTRFEPNRPIKDKEFVTMIVRALGYETPDMRNNFPFGYMSAANAIGLLQDVNMVPDTDALRGEDAQVIYNAMFVDYARGAKRVNVAHGTTVEKYPTLAEDVWHLDRAAVGTWDKHDKDDENVKLSNCKAHTWVIVGQDGDDNILAYPIEDGNTEKDSHEIYESLENKVNGVKAAAYKFKYEGTADIDTLRGYKVELWGAGKHGEPSWEKKEGKYVFSNDWKIKAIKTIAGQTKFDYDASKADSKRDDGEIKVDDETTLKLGTAADNAQKVSEKNTSKTDRTTYLSKEEYNRENVTSDKKVEAALNVRDGAQYRLMDWDGDKEIDWVVVSEASYYKVEAVSSKRLTVTSMVDVTKNKKNEEDETESLTQTWKIGDDNEIFIGKDKKNSYKVKYEVPEGLKEGDIIEVAYSTGWDKITGTVSVVEPENHKLEKVATKNHLVLTFDGEVTELAENRNEADTIVPENPSKYIDFDEEELGREFAIAKNRNGFIIHSDYATEGGDYMMVLDTDDGSNKVRGELGAMKIITEDNKVLDNVEVVSDLMIDRKTSGNGYDKDSRHFDEHQVVGNVYRYWKDADGKITKMETVVDGTQAASYEYVAKNDRLTLKDTKESYALKDAKVIFAVKPHNHENSYIQHKDNSLKVDEADVLAVTQADIPDIGDKEDTKNMALDVHANPAYSWIKDTANAIAFDTNNNKDIKGAVLGVSSFNKFNAGATKVGLVTNVAFDSNGVVSLEVATNGKTDTLSSAEKVKFEDIVSVKDYENDKSVSVASRTETINVGVMKGSNLKDSLYKNGAYAEITTDKDGKLTGVLFMDEKNKDDGAQGKVNAGNVVIGNYYQVSRKVIADVKAGSWMSVVEGSALYADKDTFHSMDTKNTQKASDFAGDATFYMIDGTPSRNDKKYAETKATILDGFDGTPDVKVGEASDVAASVIRNNNNNGDSYNVADVATKIDAEGAGDVVAVYAYKDDMDETDAVNIADVEVLKDGVLVNKVAAKDTVTINAEITYVYDTDKLNQIKVYKDGVAVATWDATANTGSKKISVVKEIPANFAGEYTLKAAYNGEVFAGGTTLVVGETDSKFEASQIVLAKYDGKTFTADNKFKLVGNNGFYVYVGGEVTQAKAAPALKSPVTGLTAADFKIKVGGTERTVSTCDAQAEAGYYYIELAGVDFTGAEKDKPISIELKNHAVSNLKPLEGIATEGVEATGGDVTAAPDTQAPVTGVENAAKLAQVGTLDETAATITEFTVKATSNDGRPVLSLTNKDFAVTVTNVTTSTDVTTPKFTVADGSKNGEYKFTFTEPTNLREHNILVTLNNAAKTYTTVKVPAATTSFELSDKGVVTASKGDKLDGKKVTVQNEQNTDGLTLKVWQAGTTYAKATTKAFDKSANIVAQVSGKDINLTGTIKADAPKSVEFIVGYSDTAKKVLTVDINDATVAELKNTEATGKTAGVKEVQEVKAAATFAINKGTDGDFKLKIGNGAETAKITAATDDDTTAKNAKTQLETTYSSKYKFTINKNKITIEAKTMTDGETIPALTVVTGGEAHATVGAAENEKTGAPAVTKVLGKVDFVIKATANAGDAGDWEVKITDNGTAGATFTVAITDGMTPDKIATAIEQAVTAASDANLEASVSGSTVTIKEKNDKATEFFKNNTFTATFAPKA